MTRETTRSLIEIALEVGYTSPSAFAQVFRRVAGVTPTEFWGDLKEPAQDHIRRSSYLSRAKSLLYFVTIH